MDPPAKPKDKTARYFRKLGFIKFSLPFFSLFLLKKRSRRMKQHAATR